MLSGGTIITTAIISYFMLGRKIRKHHALGCTLALLGFITVGIASLLNEKSAEKYSTKGLIIGILMVMGSLFTQGFLSNFEEKLLMKYEIDCQRMVGLEGFFGVIWIFLWIVIFSFIPCPNSLLCDVSIHPTISMTNFFRWEDTWKIQSQDSTKCSLTRISSSGPASSSAQFYSST